MASSRFSAATPRRPAGRLGSETPRIFTPPLRPLTPETSLGFSVIQFATEILGVTLFPWQRWLLIHALELHPDGGFRFRTVVLLVARQNGKSTLSQVLALWFMYVYGFNLVLGAAQDLDTAEEIWQGAVDLVTEVDDDEVPVRPELLELWERTVLVNGKKSLELKTGARYKAKAANRRAGRGLSGDLVILDELREHQTWNAWGAITKTTMARDEAMVWALSNAGDALSVVLSYLRKLAHAALGDPDGINAEADPAEDLEGEVDAEELALDVDDDTLGIFEWSAPPGCDVLDRDAWAQANPSLGHSISERTIAAAARTDPEEVFRTEVLCQWVDSLVPSAVDVDLLKARRDAESQPLGPVVLGVHVSPDRTTSLSVAGWRADGRKHHEVIRTAPGTGWVVNTMKTVVELHDPEAVVLDERVAGLLGARLRAAGIEPTTTNGGQLAQACMGFDDDLREDRMRWRGDPPLLAAAKASGKKTIGDGWAYAGRDGADASALVGCALAGWGLDSVAKPPTGPVPQPAAISAAATDVPTGAGSFDLATAGF